MPRRQSRTGSSSRDTNRTSSPKSPNTSKSTAAPPHTAEQSKEATKLSNIPAPGSGMFTQMAATAGGVAIGSVLGRAFGGLFERSGADTQREEKTESIEAKEHESTSADCNWEIKQFLSCIDEQRDTKLCEGFKEAMHQCKLKKSPELARH